MNILDPYGYMIPEIFPDGEPDSPLNLVTSCACEFWFDGQDASTFTLNGANVITWADKSGFGRDVTNGVDATRPTYIPATGRVVFVAANNDYLQSADFGGDLEQPTTIFIVYKRTGAGNRAIFDGLTTSDQNTIFETSGNFALQAGATLSNIAVNANDNIHCAEFNGVNGEYWINDANYVTGDVGTEGLDGVTLGSLEGGIIFNIDAELMEVIGYNCQITDAERNAVTAYLNAKWGVY